jgi:regulator-associated protein of mTOR
MGQNILIDELNEADSNYTEMKYVYYNDKLHNSNTTQIREEPIVQDWRMRERLKTVSAALVLCLNIGVDPPDVVKPSPCAKLECWVNPFSWT